MEVLLATLFFPPGHAGGTETYTLGLARALRQLGHSPSVICADDWGTGDSWHPRHKDDVYEGIPVRRLTWNWQLAPDPFVNLYNNWAVARRFVEYLGAAKPDVVHITSCVTLGAGIIAACRSARVPVVLTLTDFWFLCPHNTLLRGDGQLCEGPRSAVLCQSCIASGSTVWKRLCKVVPERVAAHTLLMASHSPKVARWRGFRGFVGDCGARLTFLKRAFDGADAVIAPTRFLRDTFERNGFGNSHMLVSPYGLDLSWRRSEPQSHMLRSRLQLGYIGQIAPLKGVDILIRAFNALGEDAPADLRVYGDFGKAPLFAGELRRLSNGNPRVQFEGPFERRMIADVLATIDVLVVPSVWYENAPLVISEAFAAGKPVIATNLGGISETVKDGVNGLLFERGDESGLEGAIRRLIEHPALLAQLREGVPGVRTIEDEVDSLLDLYVAAQKGRLMPSSEI